MRVNRSAADNEEETPALPTRVAWPGGLLWIDVDNSDLGEVYLFCETSALIRLLQTRMKREVFYLPVLLGPAELTGSLRTTQR